MTRSSRRLARQSCPEREAGVHRGSRDRARGQGTSARRAAHDRYLAICGGSLGLDAVSFWNSRWIVGRGLGSALGASHCTGPFVRLRATNARIDERVQPLWVICCEFCHCGWLLCCVCRCSHWSALLMGMVSGTKHGSLLKHRVRLTVVPHAYRTSYHPNPTGLSLDSL